MQVQMRPHHRGLSTFDFASSADLGNNNGADEAEEVGMEAEEAADSRNNKDRKKKAGSAEKNSNGIVHRSVSNDDSDDEDDLFLEPPTSLDDDEEEEEEEEEDSGAQASSSGYNLADETSMPATDVTYGSPRLKDAFNEDDSKTPDLQSSSRRNKRKNFKPRNIVYSNEEEEEGSAQDNIEAENEEVVDNHDDENSPLNLSSGENLSLLSNSQRKSLMPRKKLDPDAAGSSSPMDLSTTSAPEESSTEESRPKSLSVVRPEILFGGQDKQSPAEDNNKDCKESKDKQPSPLPFPPFFAPGLIAAAASSGNRSHPFGLASLLGQEGAKENPGFPFGLASLIGGQEGVKEAFQEVLKLYGFPKDVAETIARNTQGVKGEWRRYFSMHKAQKSCLSTNVCMFCAPLTFTNFSKSKSSSQRLLE